ncbi:MAG: hypothetical protein ACI9DC_002653 [Gammaproteobacteria bacterium]|jgi:hypothetical protein
MSTKYHLAQMNTGRALHPMDDPQMAGFMDELDPVNAIADASPGFVWRLQTDTGNATDIRPTADPMYLVNMSVWESLEQLMGFVRYPSHLALLKRRLEWFERADGPSFVMWWVPLGHIPTPEEGLERLAALAADGSSPFAFDFKHQHPAPTA